MAELVQRIRSDGRIRHIRDQRYFTWRFENPLCRYRFLFWEDMRLEGYIVLRASVGRTNRRGISIVDWEATSPQIRLDLLRAATSWGNFEDLRTWSTTLSSEAKTALQKAGFQVPDDMMQRDDIDDAMSQRANVLIKAVREDRQPTYWTVGARRLLELDNWDLRMVDSDRF